MDKAIKSHYKANRKVKWILTKGENPNQQKGKIHVNDTGKSLTETTTEITTEITADDVQGKYRGDKRTKESRRLDL